MTGHKFQEKYTGCQLIIWHVPTESEARRRFSRVVVDADNWAYLGVINIEPSN